MVLTFTMLVVMENKLINERIENLGIARDVHDLYFYGIAVFCGRENE